MSRYIIYIVLIISLVGCDEKITKTEDFEHLDVEIRMEVQILDSTYQLYSRPFTEIYFTTFKLGNDNLRYNFEQTNTTSCQNGWGVKILNYTFLNNEEKIVLSAACENYDGPNYREIEIDYYESLRRIDSTGQASLIKTFAIYYN